jgi:hypothetical protein
MRGGSACLCPPVLLRRRRREGRRHLVGKKLSMRFCMHRPKGTVGSWEVTTSPHPSQITRTKAIGSRRVGAHNRLDSQWERHHARTIPDAGDTLAEHRWNAVLDRGPSDPPLRLCVTTTASIAGRAAPRGRRKRQNVRFSTIPRQRSAPGSGLPQMPPNEHDAEARRWSSAPRRSSTWRKRQRAWRSSRPSSRDQTPRPWLAP